MKDARLYRLTALFRLRHMLGQTIFDEHAARDLDPERAGHLHDAVNDLRILIGRLESELSQSEPPKQARGASWLGSEWPNRKRKNTRRLSPWHQTSDMLSCGDGYLNEYRTFVRGHSYFSPPSGRSLPLSEVGSTF